MTASDSAAASQPLDERYQEFPSGFFDRQDDGDDGGFYATPRLVTHIDEPAIEAVGAVYKQLEINGRVLDLMSSWISHFSTEPKALIALGRNASELAVNEQAQGAVVADLNRNQGLPFADRSFDSVVCCVSIDYLIRPLEVFDEVRRVLRPSGVFCCTFSNRCFPSKAIAGWLGAGDQGHLQLVTRYFELVDGWAAPSVGIAIAPGRGSDPLYAVWAETVG